MREREGRFCNENNREVLLGVLSHSQNVLLHTHKYSMSQKGAQFSPNSEDDLSVILVRLDNSYCFLCQ